MPPADNSWKGAATASLIAAALFNEPLRPFGYKTADALIQEGRADALIAYLESLAGGSAG